MPRKKKTEENKQHPNEHFVYCSNRKCTFQNCIRRHEYAPWNVLIYEENFEPNKNGICNYFLEDK